MAFLKRKNADIYFEEKGKGDAVIAVHGLIENTSYWNLAGFSDIVSKNCRFISMDMRGHGQTTVKGNKYGFDAETAALDINALADHLKIDRFHLLTHSTGGFAGVRHAMKDSSRFASLILTNTGSFTSPVQGTPKSISVFYSKFASSFEKYSWTQIINTVKVIPGPFFRGIMESDKSENLLALVRKMVEINDRNTVAEFIRSFYTDPDPMVKGLRKIKCPVLVIFGEKDDMFIESSKLMAKEIPGAKLTEYKGIGHMTALEAPERLADDVVSFINSHPVEAE